MDQKFIDAIANVRLVSGTIRIDLMNITGQTDDKKLQFGKTGEIILTPAAFFMLRLLKPCKMLIVSLRKE